MYIGQRWSCPSISRTASFVKTCASYVPFKAREDGRGSAPALLLDRSTYGPC
jgi:hypothetical protein